MEISKRSEAGLLSSHWQWVGYDGKVATWSTTHGTTHSPLSPACNVASAKRNKPNEDGPSEPRWTWATPRCHCWSALLMQRSHGSRRCCSRCGTRRRRCDVSRKKRTLPNPWCCPVVSVWMWVAPSEWSRAHCILRLTWIVVLGSSRRLLRCVPRAGSSRRCWMVLEARSLIVRSASSSTGRQLCFDSC